MTQRGDPSAWPEDQEPEDDEPGDQGPDGDGPGGSHGPRGVRPTGPGPLVVLGLLAMVLGWSIRPLSLRLDIAEPVISVWSVVVLWVLAAGVGFVAFRTWRMLQQLPLGAPRVPRPGRGRLEPYQAVNRLMLGKAAALTGAVVLGGYVGFAIAHLGISATELSGQRLLRSVFAAAGGLALLIAGLLLERACRVRDDANRSVR